MFKGLNPIEIWNGRVFSWLLACKYNPLISRCVNKDIRKMIFEYIKIDLTEEFEVHGDVFQFIFVPVTKMYYWRLKREKKIIFPCKICLMPYCRKHRFKNVSGVYYINKKKYEF